MNPVGSPGEESVLDNQGQAPLCHIHVTAKAQDLRVRGDIFTVSHAQVGNLADPCDTMQTRNSFMGT